MNETILFKPIGIVHSEHIKPADTPIQPVFSKGCTGTVELFEEYAEGIEDLEAFSHIYIFFVFHKRDEVRLRVKPFLEDKKHGVFATRSPRRPNPIGFSVVRLKKREGNILYVEDVDILDGSPVLDIKPYIHRYDLREHTRDGWQERIDPAEAWKRGRRNYNPEKQ